MFRNWPNYGAYRGRPESRLPRIPSTWQWRRLASIGRKVSASGRPDLPLLSVYLDRGVIRYAEGGRRVHAPSEQLDAYQIVRPGDLVLNNQQAWRGSVGVSDHHGIISPAYVIWRNSSTISAQYGKYLFRAPVMVDQFVMASRGVGDIQRDLHGPSLRNLLVPVPPLEDQDAIAKYLAHANVRIDKAIAAKRRLAVLLAEGHHVYSDCVLNDPSHPNLRSVRIKSLLYEVDERSANGEEQHLSMSQEHGLVPAGRITRTLTAESMAGGRICQPGDIVLNRLKAHLGVFAVAQQAGVVSADYTVLRPQADIVPEFLCRQLRSGTMRPELRRRTKGIVEGFWRLYTEDLLAMHVRVPDSSTQERVVREIDGRDEEFRRATSKIADEIALLQEFRTRLVADVVTGQVDVRAIAASLPETPEQDTDLDSLLDDDLEDVLGEGEG